MKATKLHIEYFRGFEELDINLSESNVTLFIGVNGAGKTSVLDLIAYCVVDKLHKMLDFKYNEYSVKNIPHNEFEDVKKLWEINKQLNFTFIINLEAAPSMLGERNINRQYSKDKTVNYVSFNILDKKNYGYYSHIKYSGIKDTTVYIDEIKTQVELGNALIGNQNNSFPIFVYYCESKQKTKDRPFPIFYSESAHKFSQLLAYNNIFTNTTTIFDDFVVWFRAEDDFEKNEKIKTKNLDYESRNLKSIRNVVNGFLSQLSTEKFENLRIETKRLSDNISFEKSTIAHQVVIDKNGVEFQLAELSSGEKMLLMLVIDIARRLILANPIAEDVLLGEGIILIDEIDLHLHPTWQRQVIPALTKTFPNLQFIISTHSPFVVQSVKMSEVVVLENGKVRQFETKNEIGKEIDTESSYMSIVRDIFGIHSFFSAETELLLNEFREFRSQIMQNKPYNKVRFSKLVHILVSKGTEIEAIVNREIAQIERLTKQNLELV